MAIWEYRAELERVVDGDTMDFEVDLGFHTYKRIRVRLAGVDTHETYGVKKESEEYKKGKQETEFAKNFLDSGNHITLHTFKDTQGKYGRWLAEVKVDGRSLNDALIDEFDVAS